MVDAPHTGALVRTEPFDWPDYLGATRPADERSLRSHTDRDRLESTPGSTSGATSRATDRRRKRTGDQPGSAARSCGSAPTTTEAPRCRQRALLGARSVAARVHRRAVRDQRPAARAADRAGRSHRGLVARPLAPRPAGSRADMLTKYGPSMLWLTREGVRVAQSPTGRGGRTSPSQLTSRRSPTCGSCSSGSSAWANGVASASSPRPSLASPTRGCPHLPDGLLDTGREQIAIEVELTLKSRPRLTEILAEVGQAYGQVWYFAAPPLAAHPRAASPRRRPGRTSASTPTHRDPAICSHERQPTPRRERWTRARACPARGGSSRARPARLRRRDRARGRDGGAPALAPVALGTSERRRGLAALAVHPSPAGRGSPCAARPARHDPPEARCSLAPPLACVARDGDARPADRARARAAAGGVGKFPVETARADAPRLPACRAADRRQSRRAGGAAAERRRSASSSATGSRATRSSPAGGGAPTCPSRDSPTICSSPARRARGRPRRCSGSPTRSPARATGRSSTSTARATPRRRLASRR